MIKSNKLSVKGSLIFDDGLQKKQRTEKKGDE